MTDHDDLLDKTNVVGYGYGHRITEAEFVEQEALQVFVTQKVEDETGLRELYRNGDLIPSDIDGQPTDVIEIGILEELDFNVYEDAYPSRDGTFNPLCAGIQIQHPEGGYGTLGSTLYERDDGVLGFFTNQHVAAPYPDAEVGDPVYQPRASSGRAIGHLDEFTTPKADEPNYSDSAFVAVDDSDNWSDQVLGLGSVDGVYTGEVESMMEVWKSGRTTDVTRGYLLSQDATIKVNTHAYDEPITYRGVYIFTAFSLAGDSGSDILVKVIDGVYEQFARLFAGSTNVTVGIPIETVYEHHSGEFEVADVSYEPPEPEPEPEPPSCGCDHCVDCEECDGCWHCDCCEPEPEPEPKPDSPASECDFICRFIRSIFGV